MNSFRFRYILFGLIAFVHLFTLKGTFDTPFLGAKSCPFESTHECAPFATMLSLVHDHSFAITAVDYHFGRIDVGFYNNMYFSSFPPGVSVLIIPLYVVGLFFGLGQVGSFFTISIFAFGNAILVYFISKKIFGISERYALLSVIIFGFGTTALSYAITPYQHHISTFIFLLSFWSVAELRHSTEKIWRFIFPIVILYGISPFIDYPNLVLLFPILIYMFYILLKNQKFSYSYRISIIVASALIVLSLLGLQPLYNHLLFGDWRILQNRLPIAYKVNTIPKYGANIISIAHQKSIPWNIFKPAGIESAFMTLIFSPYRGLFYFSPILLFALGSFFKKRNSHRPLIILLWVTSLLVIIMYSMYDDPSGGDAFGPRFLIPVMAILSLIAMNTPDLIENNLVRIAFFTLLVYSEGVALVGAVTTNADSFCTTILKNCSYLFNIGKLTHNQSSSFMYATFFSPYVSLANYYLVLMTLITCVSAYVIFSKRLAEQ